MISSYRLPTRAAPKRITAYYRCDRYRDRLTAFLNANNPRGFERPEVGLIEEKTLGEILLYASQVEWITESRLKGFARKIQKGSGGAIKHNKALDIMACVVGYRGWADVKQHITDRCNWVRNRSNKVTINSKIFSSRAARR